MYNGIKNNVGISVHDFEQEVPPCVRNEAEATQLFGSFLGFATPGEYACEESVVLRTHQVYTAIAESSETFVLKIPKS